MNTLNEDLRSALEIVRNYAQTQADYHEGQLNDENLYEIGSKEDYLHEKRHVGRWKDAKLVASWCDVHKKKLGEA